MEQRFPIQNGTLTVREQNGRVEVFLEISPPDRGLYRAYLHGPGGRCDLGTLMPEGGKLRLRRSLSAAQLKKNGCWPVLGGAVEQSYSFQAPPKDGQAPQGVFRSLPQGGFELTFPWNPNAPFPLPSLFCFARVEERSVHYTFREDGSPQMPKPLPEREI